MKNVWIVYGTCGEYSDRAEWPVIGYPTEELAKEHARLAQNRANELDAKYAGKRWSTPAKANEYDPAMQSDYTGTTYGLYMVEIREAVAPLSP